MPRRSRLNAQVVGPDADKPTGRQRSSAASALRLQPSPQTPLDKLQSEQAGAAALDLQATAGNRAIQRTLAQRTHLQRDVVEMEPMEVVGYRGGTVESNVSGMGTLASPRATGFEAGRDEQHLRLNTPVPGDLLPFTETGWDAQAILTALGQFDRIGGTDSDAERCVQAVAMASFIPQGPGAVASYLNAVTFDAGVSRGGGERQRAALDVIRYVRDALQDRRATFGDLSWAQEAVHDLYYADPEGTPDEQIAQQVSPALTGLQRQTESVDIWCSTPEQLQTVAATLAPGGELIATVWQVAFNDAFEQLEDRGIATRSPMQVNADGRLVQISRIDTTSKPRPQAIDLNRDQQDGHQIMIMRDNIADGPLRIYEPEMTAGGQHLGALDAGSLGRYFTDHPEVGIFSYVYVLSRISPSQLPGAPTPQP